MNRHHDHAGQIRHAANCQSAQHVQFLHFLKFTLHFCSSCSLLYSSYYTPAPPNFNYFVQITFSVSMHFAQFSCFAMNCKLLFLQFILHFLSCNVPCQSLQISHRAARQRRLFCRFLCRRSHRSAAPASAAAFSESIPASHCAPARKNGRQSPEGCRPHRNCA